MQCGARYGFLSDVIPQQISISKLIEGYDLSFSKSIYSDNGVLKIRTSGYSLKLTDEQKQELSKQILVDVTKYYKSYFEKEKSIISETINRYYQLVEETIDSNTPERLREKAELYTKIKFLSKSGNFFKNFGISQEEVDAISSQALDCLENTTERVSQKELERKGHDSSLDLLTAVLINTGIKDMKELKQYYKDNHLDWEKDYQISDDELEQIVSEIKFTEQEIGRGTVKTPTVKKDEAQDRQNIDQQMTQQAQEIEDNQLK